jgi:hypothetical protein
MLLEAPSSGGKACTLQRTDRASQIVQQAA